MSTDDLSSALESEISDWIVKLIEDDELFGKIGERKEIEKLSTITSQSNFIPAFTVDYISRLACAQSASHVLNQLSGLEIISINKSISLQTGEILKPDIIAFNSERRTVVLFELKRDMLTEREAVTELMAYEHEVQNNLPFCANFDLCFVVVARQWSTLMDHAIGSMVTWSNKQCLAIQLCVEKDQRELRCHLPSAWSLLGRAEIPPDAMQAVDLVLYEDEFDPAEEYPPPTVLTAAQMIARNGDRANSHGFLMLWRDNGGWGNTRWIITICALDPFVFFFLSRDPSNPFRLRDSELSEFFESRADHLAEGYLPGGALKIASDAISMLRLEFDPCWENFSTWDQKLIDHRTRAFPLYFEFWGKPGEYIRHLISLPTVRGDLMPYIQAGLDWNSPEVAVPIIEDIAGRRPLKDGQVRCSDAFEIGESLQLLLFLYGNMPDGADQPWHAFARWIELRVLGIATELAQIYYASKWIDIPPPPLSVSAEKRVSSVQALMSWVEESLFGEDEVVVMLTYNIGRYGAICLEPALQQFHHEKDVKDMSIHAAELVRLLVKEMQMRYGEIRKDGGASPEQEAHYEDLISALLLNARIDPLDERAVIAASATISDDMLLQRLKDVVLPAADAIFHPVYYEAADMAALDIDWDWLKEGACRMFTEGMKRPAVIRQLSGTLSTGPLTEPPHTLLVEVSDPKKEVYFLDHSAGHSIAVKLTWDELIARFAPKT